MIKWTMLPIAALLLAGCARNDNEPDNNWVGGTSTTSSQQAGTATSDTTTTTTSSSLLSQTDQTFVKEAAAGGMAEVQMGKLAAQNGQSEAVKKLGQRLVQDHTKANQELKQIASRKGLTVSSTLDTEHQSALDHLKGLQGQEFDKAFIQHAIQDHQKAIDKFQKVAQEAQDLEIKAFAAKTLPTLQEHLQLAKQAEAQASGATGVESGTTTDSQSNTSSQTETPKQQP